MQKRLLLFAFFLFIQIFHYSSVFAVNEWERLKKEKSGKIDIYWFESKPFVFKNQENELIGIEYELIDNFKLYLKKHYGITLTTNWIESKDFADIIFKIHNSKSSLILGSSALSITEDRAQYVDFSTPYMSDISVLISSKNLPIVKNANEFNNLFSKLTAITIKGTTYEEDILNLKNQRNLPFEILYISSSDNILNTVSRMDSAFGFIDLPVYLMYFKKNPSMDIQRQNLFPIKRNGYGFALKKNSDFSSIINEFLTSEDLKKVQDKIISKYLDIEDYKFVESLSIYSGQDDDIMLLTKEKQIQNKYLKGKNEQIKLETQRRNYLIATSIVIFISLITIFIIYRKLKKDHNLVIEQKKKIEIQADNIELQNVQLENRNKRLSTLNEEKNHLIKILAHDLRSPISHIEGISQLLLLKGSNLNEEQKKHLNLVLNASMRLNKMISNILDVDAIENERVNIFLEKIDVSETTKSIIDSFERTANKKNINIHFLPLETKAYINADMLLYTEIIENLISNAIKFSPQDKSIIVSVKNENGWIIISIKDEGPGLSYEDKLLIFKKFQKLSAKPTGGEQSTGLGLSIVKKYTELMYGKISFESTLGEGTRFSVQFEAIEDDLI